MLPFAGVDVSDVLLEVLLLDVGLVAPFVGALVGALPCMGPLVDGKARGPAEGLVAARESTEEVLRFRGGFWCWRWGYIVRLETGNRCIMVKCKEGTGRLDAHLYSRRHASSRVVQEDRGSLPWLVSSSLLTKNH